MRAGGDADALLLLGQPHERHVGVLLRHTDEVDEPRLGQGRDQTDTARLEGVMDEL